MSGISLLSQLTSQLSRFDTLNTQFSDLQRSLSSNKKTTTYQGLGDDALSSLRYRTNLRGDEKYMDNIDVATTRIKTMDTSINLIQTQVAQLQKGLIQQPLDGTNNLSTLTSYANKLMEVMPANLNEQVDGHYVFAGADVDSVPYAGTSKLQAAVSADVADWMNGTIDTDTLLSRFDNYTNDQVGFTPEVLAAGKIQATADANYKIDYTFKASDPSVKNILIVGQVLKTLTVPTATDAPSKANLDTVIKAMANKLDDGADALEAQSVSLQASTATLQEIRDTHKYDKATLQSLISDVEDIDVTETAVKLQNVKLQLEASYSVTAATSGLNLLNYLK